MNHWWTSDFPFNAFESSIRMNKLCLNSFRCWKFSINFNKATKSWRWINVQESRKKLVISIVFSSNKCLFQSHLILDSLQRIEQIIKICKKSLVVPLFDSFIFFLSSHQPFTLYVKGFSLLCTHLKNQNHKKYDA